MPDNPLLRIGDFSRASSLSVKTLRAYHEAGLLEPAEVDPQTGYRSYSVAQLTDAAIIRRLRQLDLPLEAVKQVPRRPRPGRHQEDPGRPQRGGTRVDELPATEVAVLAHHGDYESMDATYRNLGAWVAEHATPGRPGRSASCTSSVPPTPTTPPTSGPSCAGRSAARRSGHDDVRGRCDDASSADTGGDADGAAPDRPAAAGGRDGAGEPPPVRRRPGNGAR